MTRALRVLSLLGLSMAGVASATTGPCERHVLDFILLSGDTSSAQIEDDIRRDLAQINIEVNTRLLEKADFNRAMQQGDFHLCFTESWGPPYDPHAFATGWFRPNNEAHYPSLDGLEAPMTKAGLQVLVTEVLTVEDKVLRQSKWSQILQEMHQQAISNPMWSRRMPAVVNRRLSGYPSGSQPPQQFDYPVHLMTVESGSATVKISPGAQTGLFSSTGPMDPHSYRPNEFFISNWIYEGLVSYQGGEGDEVVAPQLAISWSKTPVQGGGEEYRFALRPNVKFHDGTACNCSAVKMTFDHVLQPPLNSLDYHGWYHLPRYLSSWLCDGEVFVARLNETYYPFLQDLSLIRPLRVLSPQCYQNGPASSPVTHNSCPTKWDQPGGSSVRCVSVQCSHGTGPWKYSSMTGTQEATTELVLRKNDDWWGTRGNIEELRVKSYGSATAVKAALDSSELDMVVGGGVLTPSQVKAIDDTQSATFRVSYGPPLMNRIVVMNAAKAPTNDLQLRKVVMHSINKAGIVATELADTAQVADSLFPKDAPYCNVDLTPRWDYDMEKAQLMNCPAVVTDANDDSGPSTGLIVGLSCGIGIPFLVGVGAAAFYFGKKAGYKQFDKSRDKSGAPPNTVGNAGEGDTQA